MVRYCIWMSSCPLLLAGNDASPFIFVSAEVSVCQGSTTEGDKVALFQTYKTFQKASVDPEQRGQGETEAGVRLCWTCRWHR